MLSILMSLFATIVLHRLIILLVAYVFSYIIRFTMDMFLRRKKDRKEYKSNLPFIFYSFISILKYSGSSPNSLDIISFCFSNLLSASCFKISLSTRANNNLFI